VTAFINNTYHSLVQYESRAPGAPLVAVDSRPSDAINLALRFGAPVYVHKKARPSILAQSSDDAWTEHNQITMGTNQQLLYAARIYSISSELQHKPPGRLLCSSASTVAAAQQLCNRVTTHPNRETALG